MNFHHSDLLITFAGVAFFIYGMSIASDNLQRLASKRIRQMVTTLSKKPVWGLFLGVGLTMILQSSGAVTSMLVGLGSAGVINLPQVMSVILGAAVGSTFVVQILSFDISQYGLPIFAIAFFVYFLARRRSLRNVMAVAMGFGLVFWGLEMVRIGTANVQSIQGFQVLAAFLSHNPVYAVILTAFMTAIFHSSAVTIGIAMTLAAHHAITLQDSVYWIFGANIGTTAIALIASTDGNYVGRQVAWAHCFYKIASVILFYPLAAWMVHVLATGNLEHDVANINTIYNLAAALLFFPGVKYGARLVEKLFPPLESEKEYSVRFLKKDDWQSPSVVLAHAEREALRMADIVVGMLDQSLELFRSDDPELVAEMRKKDDKVDLLSRELNLYLARHLEEANDSLQLHMMRLMNFTTDFEAAADVVENQLLELAGKMHHLKVVFSEEGWGELEDMARVVNQVASMSVACFQTQDKDLAAKIVFHKRNVRKLEKRFRESHMSRLVKGTPESINTSTIHLDVLGEYRRVVGLLANHVYSVLKDGDDPYNLLPRREG